MPNQYTSPAALFFAAFRLLVVIFGALALWRGRRSLSPARLVTGLALLNTLCCILYLAPLQRPYSLAGGLDRAFAVGMAANVAEGNSAWDHVQVGQAAPEPLWNWTYAALSGFDVDRVPRAFDLVSVAAALGLPLLIFLGLKRIEGADPWSAALVCFSTMQLSSLSLGERSPTLPFWLANIQHKPNHGLGFALVAITLGFLCRKEPRFLPLALSLSALGWVFLMHWGWFLPVVLALAFWKREDLRSVRTVGLAVFVSLCALAPFVLNLARDYSPGAQDPAARHLWDDSRGRALSLPVWTVLDPAPLVLLSIVGLLAARRRDSWLDRGLTALMAGAWAVWAVSSAGAWLGFAPEPDDLHYFLRFATAAVAGLGIEDLASRIGKALGLELPEAFARALIILLPVSFAAQWYPPLTDRYYPVSMEPIHRKVIAYADFIKAQTSPRDVFDAGDEPSTFIPALTGRRVLQAPTALVPHDQLTRTQVEETLMKSGDAAAVRDAARRYEVTYLVLDEGILGRHGLGTDVARVAGERVATGAFRVVYATSLVHILAIVPKSRGSGPET